MIPQLIKIIHTKNVEGLSIEMFITYLLVQIAFSFEGYFKRSVILSVCFGLSAFVSGTILVLIAIF